LGELLRKAGLNDVDYGSFDLGLCAPSFVIRRTECDLIVSTVSECGGEPMGGQLIVSPEVKVDRSNDRKISAFALDQLAELLISGDMTAHNVLKTLRSHAESQVLPPNGLRLSGARKGGMLTRFC